MTRERAESVAVAALIWLAGDHGRAAAFLSASGVAPDDLRGLARDPHFLGFVLDFLLGDEAALGEFCDASGVAMEAPLRARRALPGGDAPEWT